MYEYFSGKFHKKIRFHILPLIYNSRKVTEKTSQHNKVKLMQTFDLISVWCVVNLFKTKALVTHLPFRLSADSYRKLITVFFLGLSL